MMRAFSCMFLLLFCVLGIRAQLNPTESSTPATTAACPELLSPSTSQSHCTPWSNCTGLNCHNPLYGNKNISIVIDKCTDPLVYHLTVYNTNSGDVLNHSVIRTAQSNDNRNYFELHIQLGRNASHAKFEVSHFMGDTAHIIIPLTYVPLNASHCMCESLTQLKDNIHSPTETNCVTDSKCVGIECDLIVDDHTYLIDTQIFPCANPPGYLFAVLDPDTNYAITEEYFDHSQNTTLFGNPFNVEVTQLNYSMIIHGILDVDGTPYDVIPETQIILDKENCPVPTTTTVTPTKTPTATPIVIAPQTCDTLKQFAEQASAAIGECVTNKACDSVLCNTITGYKFNFTILPCNSPPALHTVVLDSEGNVVFDTIVTNRTEIPVGPFGTKLIVVVRDAPGEMTVEVLLQTTLTGELPFLPETSIPIDDCQCVRKDTSYPSTCLATPTLSSSSTTRFTQPTHSYSRHAPGTATGSTAPTVRAHSEFFKSTNGIIVISSIAVVFLVIVAVVIIVVVIIVVLRKKKSGGYSFQRMSMRNVQEDDGEVET